MKYDDEVITVGDLCRFIEYFEALYRSYKWYNFIQRSMLRAIVDTLRVQYTWVRAGKPPISTDIIFMDEKGELKS